MDFDGKEYVFFPESNSEKMMVAVTKLLIEGTKKQSCSNPNALSLVSDRASLARLRRSMGASDQMVVRRELAAPIPETKMDQVSTLW